MTATLTDDGGGRFEALGQVDLGVEPEFPMVTF
jgi:hypothetical protein